MELHLQGTEGPSGPPSGTSKLLHLGRVGAGKAEVWAETWQISVNGAGEPQHFPNGSESRRQRDLALQQATREWPSSPSIGPGGGRLLFPPAAKCPPGFWCRIAPNPRGPGILCSELRGDHAVVKNTENGTAQQQFLLGEGF